jgi:hypothetical protein
MGLSYYTANIAKHAYIYIENSKEHSA